MMLYKLPVASISSNNLLSTWSSLFLFFGDSFPTFNIFCDDALFQFLELLLVSCWRVCLQLYLAIDRDSAPSYVSGDISIPFFSGLGSTSTSVSYPCDCPKLSADYQEPSASWCYGLPWDSPSSWHSGSFSSRLCLPQQIGILTAKSPLKTFTWKHTWINTERRLTLVPLSGKIWVFGAYLASLRVFRIRCLSFHVYFYSSSCRFQAKPSLF